MTVRSKSKNRCAGCGLREVLCICAEAPALELRTRISVIMHKLEVAKTTSTARLLQRAVPACDLRVRGILGQPLAVADLADAATAQPLLLFPSDDARELTPELVASFAPRPIRLIVPDGNWHQARKVINRVKKLDDVPRVKLAAGARSAYRLRHSPDPANLATYEAVARAIGVIEGAETQAILERFFARMVERALWSRGKLSAENCEFGIPAAAFTAFHADGRRGSEGN